MSNENALKRGLSFLCCVAESEKAWADGEDEGDAKYESVAGGRGTGIGSAADKRICVPQKIDPKTFFANERTFLKWLSISVLVGLMSITLLSFSDASSDGAIFAGLSLLPVSILFMLYSLYIFRDRANKIYMREPMRYDDTRGPTMLVVVLGTAMLLATMFSLQHHYARSQAARIAGNNAKVF